MMLAMSVMVVVFQKVNAIAQVMLKIVRDYVVVQLREMTVVYVTAMVSKKDSAIVKVKNSIVHSNVVEALLSTHVESATDQVLSLQCAIVILVFGIVKIHLYVVLVK